jgi:hypothetical protein
MSTRSRTFFKQYFAHNKPEQERVLLMPSPLSCAVDAGADYSSYVSAATGYDFVQSIANAGQFEAVLKLVEAGASWRLAKGQPRAVGVKVMYVPEILAMRKPGLKVGCSCRNMYYCVIRLRVPSYRMKQHESGLKASCSCCNVSYYT